VAHLLQYGAVSAELSVGVEEQAMVAAENTSVLPVMERVARTRLDRFARIAEVAEQSDSPLWRNLARTAARAAYRDYLLVASAQLHDMSTERAAA
jgi:hypothetical protein